MYSVEHHTLYEIQGGRLANICQQGSKKQILKKEFYSTCLMKLL